MTGTIEMQHKFVEDFCGSGHVEGVTLQQKYVVGRLLKRSFTGGLPKL